MGMKNKIILSLLTGAVVASSVNLLPIVPNNEINYLYKVSDEYISINNELISETSIKVPITDYMVPQGITFVDGYYLTSFYDYTKSINSCIYVLDGDGNVINCCDINNKSHVGGISYDETNRLLWVTGSSGNVNVYSIDCILNEDNASPLYENLNVGNGLKNYQNPELNSASFLTVYNQKLFVGNFSLSNQGYIKEFDISVDDITKTLSLEFVRKIAIPNKVQGVAFYLLDGNEYIIFNRSYGVAFPSIIQVFEYSSDINNYNDAFLDSFSVECLPMLEQAVIVDDIMYFIYESGSLVYKNYNSCDNFCKMNLKKLVKSQIKKDIKY